MLLPLTSLIPTVVEITRFISHNWPHIWWFPNWYLGVPLRFVTGPVVPVVVLLLRRFVPWSMGTIYIGLIGAMWMIGAIGVKVLIKNLNGGKQAQWLGVIFYLIFPLHILLLAIGTGLHHIALSLLPWVLVGWGKYLKKSHSEHNAILASDLPTGRERAQSTTQLELESILTPLSRMMFQEPFWLNITILFASLMLLIDVSSLLPLIIGLICITLVRPRTEWLAHLVNAGLVLFSTLSIATIWYTPRFWWTLLGNPSFAGKPLANVIPFILQLTQSLIPLLIGAWVVQKRYRLKYKVTQFAVFFGSSFLFLTLIRFFSDVDFWMDWVGYGLELQFALALILPLLLKKIRSINYQFISLTTLSILTIVSFSFVWKLFGKNLEVEEYKKDIASIVTKFVKPNERIFVSGSPVFWLGSAVADPESSNDTGSLKLLQVRGGRDEVSTHPNWARGAYVIREGENTQELDNWLKILGISHILIHDKNSREYFQDFKNLDRFNTLKKIAESKGDMLYKTDGSIASVVDKELQNLSRRAGMKEAVLVAEYASLLKLPLDVSFPQPNKIRVIDSRWSLPRASTRGGNDIQGKENSEVSDEIISLAVTYDPDWKLVGGQGRVTSDGFGNLIIVPSGNRKEYILKYHASFTSWLWGVGATVISLILLSQSSRLAHFIHQKAPSLSLPEKDEEEEY